MKNVLIVGIGLIGGSIARALKQTGKYKIFAMDRNSDTLLDALSSAVIDSPASEYDLGDMDVIYLCLYPEDCIDFLKKNIEHINSDTVVTDTCGVKTTICQAVKEIQRDNELNFVAGHPMAGKEKNGFAASDPSIFIAAPYIIAETGAARESVKTVSDMAMEMGFGRIVHTTPEEHDSIISFTSQMPHVLACAYVLSPRCKMHDGFSAGSYRDISRVADINEKLWSRLFLDNRKALIEELDTIIGNIELYKQAIVKDDEQELRELLGRAALIKRSEGN